MSVSTTTTMDEKKPAASSDTELSFPGHFPRDLRLVSRLRILRSARAGLTVIAFLAASSVLAVSAQAMYVFETTNVRADILLSLWPDNFDLQPTVALVACSAIIVFANAIYLLVESVPDTRVGNYYSFTTMLAPLVSFVAALAAVASSYAVYSSPTTDTLQSWTCRWEKLAMHQAPYFSTLCHQSRAGLYLAVLLIPLEMMLLLSAVYQSILVKKVSCATAIPLGGERKLSSGSDGGVSPAEV